MSIDTIYADVCEEKHRKFTDGELKAWKDVLGRYSDADIDAALRRHRNNTAIDEFTQKPIGDIMPMPASLKLSIERFNAANLKKFHSCGQCENGWVRVFKGFTIGDEAGTRNAVDPKVGAVRRCACHLEWERQKTAA